MKKCEMNDFALANIIPRDIYYFNRKNKDSTGSRTVCARKKELPQMSLCGNSRIHSLSIRKYCEKQLIS